MTKILFGKEVADKITDELKARVAALGKKAVTPCLAILRVGERPDDIAYEKGAISRAAKVGVAVKKFTLPENTTQAELEEVVQNINQDRAIHGCLIFRPLPKHLDTEKICKLLCPEKDIDGMTNGSMAGVYKSQNLGFAPCTAEAAIAMLKHYNINLRGANAVVLGRSLVIGKPVAMMLLKENATVTICHTKTVNLAKVANGADVLICCAGSAQMVDKTFLRQGQTVIDVGINVSADGNMVGDVNFADADGLVDAVSPVPRGVGSVTTTILMQHVVEAAERS